VRQSAELLPTKDMGRFGSQKLRACCLLDDMRNGENTRM
jgi:hypothetical protein